MSANPAFQTIILGDMDKISVSFRDQITNTVYADIDFRTPADLRNSSAPSGHTTMNTVPVKFIKDEEKLPSWFFQNIPLGSKEFYACRANLRYKMQKSLTVNIIRVMQVQ